MVAAGTVLVAVMILMSFPGVAAAAATESAFLTEIALRDGLKRDPSNPIPGREVRAKRETSHVTARSRLHGWTNSIAAPTGLDRWTVELRASGIVPEIGTSRIALDDTRVTVLHLDLPPPVG